MVQECKRKRLMDLQNNKNFRFENSRETGRNGRCVVYRVTDPARRAESWLCKWSYSENDASTIEHVIPLLERPSVEIYPYSGDLCVAGPDKEQLLETLNQLQSYNLCLGNWRNLFKEPSAQSAETKWGKEPETPGTNQAGASTVPEKNQETLIPGEAQEKEWGEGSPGLGTGPGIQSGQLEKIVKQETSGTQQAATKPIAEGSGEGSAGTHQEGRSRPAYTEAIVAAIAFLLTANRVLLELYAAYFWIVCACSLPLFLGLWYVFYAKHRKFLAILTGLLLLSAPLGFQYAIDGFQSPWRAWILIYTAILSLIAALSWKRLVQSKPVQRASQRIPAIGKGRFLAGGVSACMIALLFGLPRPEMRSCAPSMLDHVEFTVHASHTLQNKVVVALIDKFLRKKGAATTQECAITDQEGRKTIVYDPVSYIQKNTALLTVHKEDPSEPPAQHEACDLRTEPLDATPSPAVAMNRNALGTGAIAVIVNPNSATKKLTKQQIREFLEKPYPNVNLYIPANQEELETIKSLVHATGPLSDNVKPIEESSDLVNAVAKDPYGIGLIDFTALSTKDNRVKKVAISDPPDMVRDVDLTKQSLANGDYPLAYRLYLFTPASKRSQFNREFESFLHLPEAAEIIDQSGFIRPPPPISSAEPFAPGEKTCRGLIDSDVKIPVDIRFDSGKSDLDNRAHDDIARIVAYIKGPVYNGQYILVLGFADDIQGTISNEDLSRARAERVKEDALVPMGIKSEVDGLGTKCPVDRNKSDEARERNRRVEVWVRQ